MSPCRPRLTTVWGTDATAWSVLVYDAKTRKIVDVDPVEKIERAKHQPCQLGLSAIPEWASETELRVQVSDWYEVGDDGRSAHRA